jgi:uncharacterized repeat protein (TIGR02543 family)
MNQLKHLKTFSLRAALVLLVMMLTATTARALTVTCLYYDNASSSYLEGTVGGTYSVSADGTKLYVTPNPGYYLVSVMRTGITEPLIAIGTGGEDPYYTVSASDVITITFKPYTNNVRVRFYMQGHGTAPANQDLRLGEKVTRPTPDPTAYGYDFLGWFTNSSCTTPYDFATVLDNTLSYNTNIDCYTLTLYAKWESQAVRVSFDMNGQDGTAPANQDLRLGDKATRPTPAPTAGGYTLIGWFKDRSCKNLYDFDTVLDNTLEYSSTDERYNLKLYAGWVAESAPTSGTSGNMNWQLSKSTGSEEYYVLTISGSGAMVDYEEEKAPWYPYHCVIKTVVIGDRVTSIGTNAFHRCYALTEAVIPASVTSIGGSAFRLCYALTTVSIPTSVTTLADRAFYNTGLTSITIPASVTAIGEWSFMNCSSLASVTIYAPSLTTYGIGAFDNNADGRKIYVFSDCVDTYKENLHKFVSAVEAIPDVAVNDAGGTLGKWTTYYNGLADVTVPATTTVYKATYNSVSGNVELTTTGSQIIKRGEAVMLKSADAVTLSSAANGGEGDYTDNALQGVDVATATSTLGEGTFYVLGKVGDNFGFHRYTGTTMPAQKAYLLLSGSAAPSLSMTFGDEKTTGMRPTPDPSLLDGGEWYDLSVRRLSEKPSTKGLYIHNGRKEVVK